MVTSPFIPPTKRGGRRRTTDMRETVNALLYIAASGCAWRLLPKCFPPVSTVRRYFYVWRDAGLFDAINMALVMSLRKTKGREASPSAGVIDSQSVKTTESDGICGYDAGKKVKGHKRHILTDTCGFLVLVLILVLVLVHAADIHDRDGAVDVLKAIRHCFPWLRHVFADGSYAEQNYATQSSAMATGPLRSSSDQMPQRGSRSYLDAGLSSAPSHGSDDAAAWPKIGKPPSPLPSQGR